ncbi:MAG: ABC transporter permease [Bacillota bacterium]|nr:ABC transporter permease [Bacillota bacterium]
MKKLTKYEIKKVFSGRGGRTALIILAAAAAVICFFACSVSYVDEQGISQSGHSAVMKLREAQKEWTGILDEETLAAAVASIREVTDTPDYNSKDIEKANIAYSRLQGVDDIRELLNHSFAEDFRTYDYFRANSLQPEDAGRFYTNRVFLLKEWLNSEAETMYSDSEKAYLTSRYEELETPFLYDYTKGWDQIFEYSNTVIMIMMLVMGVFISGIFSNESALKADSVFFTSLKGRDRAVAAKLRSGIIIVTGVYFIVMSVFSAAVLGYLGADGMNCPVQIIQWKSMYNLKIWQEFLLVIAGGYLGCLFLSSLCMLVSAKTNSTVAGAVIPFVMIFLPSFLSNLDIPALNKILGLLPDQLLQINMVFRYFNLYEVGGRIFTSLVLLFALYPVLTCILIYITYNVYVKKEIC